MEPPSFGSPTSLRSIPPGTLAAACSGDLFRLRDFTHSRPADSAASRDSESRGLDRRGSEGRRARRPQTEEKTATDYVAFAVFEIDPPIPLSLASEEKAALATQRARVVRCNAEMATLSGYSCVDALEGTSLEELLGSSEHQGREYFKRFFEHDLVHEGLIQEHDRSGRTRVFATRSVGVDRNGLLFEVITTKSNVRSCAAVANAERPRAGRVESLAARTPAPRVEPGLAATIRKLKRSEVEDLLSRTHDELAHRRHALLEYQQHGLAPGLLPRFGARASHRPTPPAPQELFKGVQTTVLSVLDARVRQPASDAQSPDGVRHPFPRQAAEAHEFPSVLGALERTCPGAAERLLAEVLVHWKAKEELMRRDPPGESLAWCLGPRTLRSALRALVGDPSLGCMLRILRRSELH